jgi:flagellar protein FlgJ
VDVKAVMSSAMDATSLEGVAKLERDGKSAKDIAKVKKLAGEFEAMFMEQMLKSMRSSVQKSGLIDGGNAEEIYTSMLDSEYSKAMGGSHSNGIADMVEQQLLRSMGVKTDVASKAQALQGKKSYEQGTKLIK